MRNYSFTERGQELASDLGADKLFGRLIEEDKLQPLLDAVALEDDPSRSYGSWMTIEDREAKDEAIRQTQRMLQRDENDLFIARQALALPFQDKTWKQKTGKEGEERLFEVESTEDFVPANEADAYVLSGVLGLQYARRHAVRTVLSRHGYEKTPLNNRIEVAAVIGASLVNDIISYNDIRLSRDLMPQYEIERDDGKHAVIEVGGDFHGDFRMFQTTSLTRDIISPLGESSEFCPEKTNVVAGYHSVEPDITAAMLEYSLEVEGLSGIENLLAQFKETLNKVDPTQLKRGAFADFGMGATDFHSHWLGLLKRGEVSPRERIFSRPYLPQSSSMFQAISTSEGLLFNNGKEDEEGEAIEGIVVRYEEFPMLFEALVEQACRGLGRTAVIQHAQLVNDTIEEMSV